MFKTIWRPFYQIPFVYLTSFMVFGMLFTFFFEVHSTPSFLLLLIAIFLSVIMLRWNFKYKFSEFFTFFGLQTIAFLFGVWMQAEREEQSQVAQFTVQYQENDRVLLHLLKVENTHKDWGKGLAEVKQLNESEFNPSYKILFFFKKDDLQIKQGDLLWSSSPIEKIKNKGNPGEFDGELYWKSQGVFHLTFLNPNQIKWIDHLEPNYFDKMIFQSFHFLKGILNKYLEGDALALAEALILGDKSDLSDDVKTGFTKTGALHVLAVSGLHIGIIMQILMYLLKYFAKWLSRNKAVLAVVLLMWFYAFLTGFSASVVRSVFMFSILSLAQLLGKNYNPINVLFCTGFTLLLSNQNYLWDIGFQLSFLAMLGIFLFYDDIQQFWKPQNKILKLIWQGTAVGFAAQLLTTPLSLYYFHQFPNYFILTNLGLMASTGLILGGGILLFATGYFNALAKIVAFFLMFVLNSSLWVISFIENLPGGVAYGYTFSFVFVVSISIFICLRFSKGIHRKIKWVLNTIIIIHIVFFVGIRWKNMRTNDLWVFNDNKVIVAVKIGQKTYCFYEHKKIEKVKRQMVGFQSIYPSSVHYYSLNKDYTFRSEIGKISVQFKEGNYRILTPKKKLVILKRAIDNENKLYKLALPFYEGNADFYLKSGAYRLIFD